MSIAPRTRLTQTTRLRIPKRTGSPGDTLIAWGLAIVASEVHGRPVELSDAPDAFHITIRTSPEQLQADCARYQPTTRVMLPWLASTEGVRQPPAAVAYSVDRDVLRDDHARLRQRGQQAQRPDSGGDAPAVTAHPLAPKYRLFQVLTNPGTQWAGYNSFVERLAPLWSPAGAAAILTCYVAGDDDLAHDVRLDDAVGGLGIARPGERRRNPPGFLFPGANKGPTMRLDRDGAVVGQASAPDWMLADRGDLSAIELYLAYVGYFALGLVISPKGSRVVAVPVPRRVQVPRILDVIGRVQPRVYPDSPPALASEAVLAYADAALEYVAGLRAEQPAITRSPLVLTGVQLSFFWMPSGNTYAVDQVGFAPLPRWLEPLVRADDFDVIRTRETITRHRAQVRGVGLAEGGEAREAALAYRVALDGDARAWLRVIPLWYQTVLAEQFVGSWSESEIRRIAVALAPDLSEIIDDPAFVAVTGALRRVTVQAHYSRQQRRSGGGGGGGEGEVLVSDRPGSRLSPQYDLIGALREAADRHPDEFLRELCEFVADYNNEAMRRQQRLIRQEDIAQIVTWSRGDRRGLIPALLLAFGVSPRRRSEPVAPAAEEEVTPSG